MVDYDSLDSDELLALANLYFDNEDYIVALPILKKLVNLEMAPVGAFSTLGRIYSILGLFERAKAAFDAYLGFRPNAIPERFEKGLVLKQMGRDDEALAIWENILKENEHFAPALYTKALYLRENDRVDEAIDVLTLLIENTPPEDNHLELANQLLSELSLYS
ncbi:tetratricopeptide repeat protein [Vibrio vulnificus]|nr:hypothetical protein [Vibrio vulnificus]ELI3521910.1 hypothetical protein [Vibrio vulnificus]